MSKVNKEKENKKRLIKLLNIISKMNDGYIEEENIKIFRFSSNKVLGKIDNYCFVYNLNDEIIFYSMPELNSFIHYNFAGNSEGYDLWYTVEEVALQVKNGKKFAIKNKTNSTQYIVKSELGLSNEEFIKDSHRKEIEEIYNKTMYSRIESKLNSNKKNITKR